MVPVYASKFLSKLTPDEQKLAIKGGIMPVNDMLMPMHKQTSDVWLLRGGRGGGKSEGVYDRLINNCLNDEYFNCYFGRKIWDTVHETCFETIYTSIEKLGLSKHFRYSTADNSSMVIRCKHNKNKFQPFGASNPQSLKSIKDPTHIVCEEFDQFSFKDFQDLFPTLRTIRATCEFFGMFNTKDVFLDHWIIMLFFPELYIGKEVQTFDALEGISIKHIFINYDNNHFLDKDDYLRRLRLSSGGNQFLFESIANGAWGVIENGNPWMYAFRDIGKANTHIHKTPFLRLEPVYLTFDINADPLSCTAWQRSRQMGGEGAFLHCIREFGGHIKVDDICAQILTAFPNSILYVTGDRSGQNQDVGRNQTIYEMIQSLLKLSDAQMNLNTANLEHADSRLLCNAIFHHYPVLIDPCCVNLIADIRKATVDLKSVKGSQLQKDRENYKMDYFDGMRYLFQTYYLSYIREQYLRLIS